MKLIIGPTTSKTFQEDVYEMQINMLLLNGTHLFIASHRWDSIEITLTEDCVPEKFKYLGTITDKLITKVPSSLMNTQNTMRCLCELYPSLSGTIRKYFTAKMDISSLSDDIIVVSEEVC